MVSSDESCSERDRLRVSSLGFPSRVLLERSGTNGRDVRRIATYAKPFTRFDLVSNLTCSMSTFAACIVSDCFFASTFVSASVQAQLRRPVSSDLRLPSLLAVTVVIVFSFFETRGRRIFRPTTCFFSRSGSRRVASLFKPFFRALVSVHPHVPIGSLPSSPLHVACVSSLPLPGPSTSSPPPPSLPSSHERTLVSIASRSRRALRRA